MEITQAKTGVEVERLPELPKVGPIGYASVVDIQGYAKTLTIGPHLPGVRDVALWTTDQLRAYATASLAAERAEAVRLSAALRDAIFELEFSGMAYDHPKLVSLRAALSPSQQGEPR